MPKIWLKIWINQNYHNEARAHSSLNKKTPNQKAANDEFSNKVAPMENIR